MGPVARRRQRDGARPRLREPGPAGGGVIAAHAHAAGLSQRHAGEAGGAAAVATKKGFWAVIAGFFAAAWKFIAVAVVGYFAYKKMKAKKAAGAAPAAKV